MGVQVDKTFLAGSFVGKHFSFQDSSSSSFSHCLCFGQRGLGAVLSSLLQMSVQPPEVLGPQVRRTPALWGCLYRPPLVTC